jgi:hypothetical protein
MTTNKNTIYLDVKTEDICSCYKLFKNNNLLEQIISQYEKRQTEHNKGEQQ